MLQKIQMHLKVAHRGMTLKKQFQRKRKNFGLKLMFDIYTFYQHSGQKPMLKFRLVKKLRKI